MSSSGVGHGGVAQLARANGSYPLGRWFEPTRRYHLGPLVKRLRHRPFTAVTRVQISYGSPYGSIAQLGEHLPYKQRVIGSSPIVPTTSERTLLRSDFSLQKNHSHAPSFLLFRKKARSARLFACKRAYDGSLSLPPFCEEAPAAQISLWLIMKKTPGTLVLDVLSVSIKPTRFKPKALARSGFCGTRPRKPRFFTSEGKSPLTTPQHSLFYFFTIQCN